MARALRLLDLAWLLDGRSGGEWLEIENRVLAARPPLPSALRTLLPGLNREQAVVVDTSLGLRSRAMVLVRPRPGRAEADLEFVLPALEQANGATLNWARVITEACHWLGRQGTQRVYAAVDEDDRLALQVFRQVGFVVYTGDEVLRLGRAASATAPDGCDEDLHGEPPDAAGLQALHGLVEAGLPAAVRAHLPGTGADWDVYPSGGSAFQGQACAACYSGSSLVGGWRAVAGSSGSWLRVATASDHGSYGVLADAVRTLAGDRRFADRPLYAAARGYEPELHVALRQVGFEAIAGRFRLVRHATVRVLAPDWQTRARRGRALGTKPTTYAGTPVPPTGGGRQP